MKLQRLKVVLAAAATLGVSTVAVAQTPFAGEDFDGGTTNGGFSAATSVFTPDNSASTPRGTFNSGSLFDRFGVVNTADNLPFGVVDESLVGFPADTAGFVPEGKADNFVLSVDIENGNNPSGTATAEWTFDITGRSNLQLSMDMGMIGTFEGTDVYEFVYSIDGGTPAPAFRVEGLTGEFYSYTMDNGTFIDRFASGFFDDTEWQDVVDNGPTPGVFDYHVRDDGTGDDTAAQDGLVPVTFADGVEEVRAYQATNGAGTFDQEEFAPVANPLGITSGDGALNQDQLIADFANYATALAGSGTTLTLTLNAASNGGDEYFAFDNILLSEGESTKIPGDFDMDGDVDIIDFGIFADNFGGAGPIGDFEPDGDVDIIDFGVFADNFGTGSSSTTIPEPTSLLILAVTTGLFAARRNC